MFKFKKITAPILSLMLILSSVSFSIYADDTEGMLMIVDASNLSKLSKGNAYSTISTDIVRLSDKSLKLNGDGTTSGSTSSESKRYLFDSPCNWTSYSYINILAVNTHTDNSKFRLSLTIEGTEASSSKGMWYKDNIPVSGDSWTIVSIDLSTFRQAYNGSKEPGDKYSEMNNIEGIFFDGINGEFYVDSVWISTEMPVSAECIKTSVQNGYDDVNTDISGISFTYNTTLADESVQTGNAVLTDGENEIQCTIEYSSDEVYVSIDSSLEAAKEYSLTVSGIMDTLGADAAEISLAFRTSESGLYASAPLITDENDEVITQMPSDGKIKASAKANNLTEGSAEVTLVLACYDADMKMIADKSVFETVSIDAGKTDIEIVAEIIFDDSSVETICAFVLDNLTDRNLLNAEFTSLANTPSADSQIAEGSSNELTLNSFDFANDTVSIDASLNGGMKRAFLITVMLGDSIKHMSVMTNAPDGTLDIDHLMTDADKTGNYTIEVRGRKVSGTISKDFYHLSEIDKEVVFEKVNKLKKAEDASEIIKTYREVFQIDEDTTNDDVIMHMVGEALIYNIPYDNFESIKSFAKEAIAVCSELNSQSWDTLAGFITENEKILIGSNDIRYFKNLSRTKQNKVCKEIKNLEFESLDDLYQKLSDAVDNYKASLKSSGSSGGGSRGGSSKSNYNIETVIPLPEPTPAIPESPTENNSFAFTDLGEFPWAEESIGNLLNAKIISESEDGRYRPGDMITRAEFVKLLVCAMYETNENAGSNFSDVSAIDWCYPYVSVASSLGIVYGRENGSFGKDELITREEIAAIIYRTIISKNMNIASGLSEYEYSDDSDISDFARDAVYALYHSGIMAGTGNDMFSATENANRAQAACVIDRLMKGGTHE